MICSWANLPPSSATTLAHAFSTPTKVKEFGHTPSCAWCHCSHLSYHPWWVSLVLKPECLPLSSYVWNLGTLHFPTTRNPDQADQLMHSPHPRCKWYHKYRESCTDLLFQ
jgi:hypothetical protein